MRGVAASMAPRLSSSMILPVHQFNVVNETENRAVWHGLLQVANKRY